MSKKQRGHAFKIEEPENFGEKIKKNIPVIGRKESRRPQAKDRSISVIPGDVALIIFSLAVDATFSVYHIDMIVRCVILLAGKKISAKTLWDIYETRFYKSIEFLRDTMFIRSIPCGGKRIRRKTKNFVLVEMLSNENIYKFWIYISCEPIKINVCVKLENNKLVLSANFQSDFTYERQCLYILMNNYENIKFTRSVSSQQNVGKTLVYESCVKCNEIPRNRLDCK